MLKPLLYTTDPVNYPTYLNEKIAAVRDLFRDLPDFPEPVVYASAPEYFRSRAEFAVFKEGDALTFSMFEKSGKDRIRHNMSSFPMAVTSINEAMRLMSKYLPKYHSLFNHLFEVEFLSAKSGETVISLSYRRKIPDTAWREEALRLRAEFAAEGFTADFVGHAHKQIVLAEKDSVLESLHTDDGHDFRLHEVNGTFSQPNAGVAEHMVSFARSCCENCSDSDLIELYCGSGTFTVCLADLFRKAMSTEVARVPTQTAIRNIAENHLTNVKIARLSAVEVAEALSGVREFHRLKEAEIDLKDYDFKTLLIDPPRCGLNDQAALDFTAKFDRVIYISCNPQTLLSDLKYLTRTHRIVRSAFFDQFPYTPHLESGVLLERR